MKYLALALLIQAPLAWSSEITGDLGVIHTQSPKEGPVYTRPYGNLSLGSDFKYFETKASVRGFTDISEEYDQDRFEVRELYLNKQTDSWNHRVGAQLISFSETFGVQILDVANPRDYTDFIINDISWSKLPVWAINSLYTSGKASLQLIYTPYAGKDILPPPNSFFDVGSDLGLNYTPDVGEREVFKDDEYGARAGYLFANGLDFNVLAYRHFNRTPAFILQNLELRPVYGQVTSFGSSFSYVSGDLVFRGDTLLTKNDFYTKDLGFKRGDRLQFIYGFDYTFNEEWTIGYQIQYRDLPTLHWNSFFVQHQFTKSLLFEFFGFMGGNNGDFWYQPKVTYVWGDAFLTVLFDGISASEKRPGIFTPYQDKDRYLVNLGYKF